jgi:hypothetical protein
MFNTGRYCRIALSLRDMVVPKTLANFLERKTQLYEQGAIVRKAPNNKLGANFYLVYDPLLLGLNCLVHVQGEPLDPRPCPLSILATYHLLL